MSLEIYERSLKKYFCTEAQREKCTKWTSYTQSSLYFYKVKQGINVGEKKLDGRQRKEKDTLEGSTKVGGRAGGRCVWFDSKRHQGSQRKRWP